MNHFIDSHIHIDQYDSEDIEQVINQDRALAALICVSSHLNSCKNNLTLSEQYQKLKPAFGWHPEQKLISDHDLVDLLGWMEKHKDVMIAVGEVGLPYYIRQESTRNPFPLEGYLEVLEQFIVVAKKWDKPIILHAVYDDAPLVCDLLERYSLPHVHFHWFKGDAKTISRMRDNGYYISVTPDIVYKERSRDLIKSYPFDKILVETDGPWPYEGPFNGNKTHPSMIHHSIKMIATIKRLPLFSVYRQLFDNTKQLYRLNISL